MGKAQSASAAFDKEESFAEQWPYLRYLGMGVWWAWIWLCYNSVEVMRLWPDAMQPANVMGMYRASTLSIAAMMIIAALCWRKFSDLVERRPVVVGFAVLASVSTLALGFVPLTGSTVAFIIAAMLTGVGTSMICLRCGVVYGSLAMRESLTSGAASLVMAAFLYYMGCGIPQEARIFFIAALPTIAAFLLIMPGDDPFPAAGMQRGSLGAKIPGRRSYRHLVAASAAVAFTAGVGKGIATTTMGTGAFIRNGSTTIMLVALFAVLIVLMVNRGDIVRATKRVYSGLMLLGVVVLLASCFGLSLSYLSVGKELLWMVFSCFMAYMVFRFDFNPVQAFGFGQAAYFIVSTLGWIVGGLLSENFDMAYIQLIVAVFFSFLIVLILTFLFTDADIKFILTWRGHAAEAAESVAALSKPADALTDGERVAQPSDDAIPADAPIALLVECIDPKYGVSSREKEILVLFAQGRSANWIAEELTISKNTVRSHLRAIYTKLDVHTRQDLLDFLRDGQ